jgi:selenocysteine lyase/cysteine desulfurase
VAHRDAFDIPEDVTYLNCAYFSPKPYVVLEAGRRAIAGHSHPWEVGPRDFYEPAERLRVEFASLIGGDADGVAFVPSVSYGVGVAARNLVVGPGRTVVVADEQFPSDIYPWRRVISEQGGSILTVAHPGGGAWTESVIAAIDGSTAVVNVPAVHWTDGRAFDLVAIGAAARAVGAALVVDLSQSLAAAPFDVAAVQPDFLISVGYKWQFGPYGYCYLWAAPQHRNGTPIEDTWIGRKGSEDFSRLVDYTDEFQPGARRFDVGEFSNFILVPMAIAAIEFVNQIGPDIVAATVEPLTAAIEEGSRELGLVPVRRQDRLAHLLGVRFPHGIPDGLRERLAADQVFVSIRGDAVRVAPNVYNTMTDVERLLEAFAAVV